MYSTASNHACCVMWPQGPTIWACEVPLSVLTPVAQCDLTPYVVAFPATSAHVCKLHRCVAAPRLCGITTAVWHHPRSSNSVCWGCPNNCWGAVIDTCFCSCLQHACAGTVVGYWVSPQVVGCSWCCGCQVPLWGCHCILWWCISAGKPASTAHHHPVKQATAPAAAESGQSMLHFGSVHPPCCSAALYIVWCVQAT